MIKLTLSGIIFFLSLGVAHASLGDSESSVEADRKLFLAVRNEPSVRGSYTVHEIANQRITIKEYVSGGAVFALSWTGARHPDLRKLLGRYYSDFEHASRNSQKIKGSHSHGVLHGETVVVERSGHMRWVQGKAYVPALMPHGVSAHDLQ